MQLLDYLKSNRISDENFAALLGGQCTSHAVKKWKYRERSPSAQIIYKIKKLTDGAVSLEDWVSKKPEAA